MNFEINDRVKSIDTYLETNAEHIDPAIIEKVYRIRI